MSLSYKFPKDGRYELILSFRDYPGKLILPFEVKTKVWPDFSRPEKQYVKKNPDFPRFIRVTVECEQCKAPYFFEETVLPDSSPQSGVFRFPDSGVFECTSCGAALHLKDLQG